MFNAQVLVAKPIFAMAGLLVLSLTIMQPLERLAKPRMEISEGRRPISKPIVIGPGDEGAYIVTRNITVTAPDPIIQVLPGTGAVDIDLSGFTVGLGGGTAIDVRSVDTLNLHNGHVKGGVSIVVARTVVVEDLTIIPGDHWGLSLSDVSRFFVRRNMIAGGHPALRVTTTRPLVFGGVIEENVFDGARGVKLWDLQNVDVVRNRIRFPGTQAAIDVAGCTNCRFAENLIYDVTKDDGMFFDRVTGSRIDGNVVGGCSNSGIVLTALSSYNRISDNTVTGNREVGLLIQGSGNFIERNLLSANGSWGLRLEGIDNVYSGNVGNHNGGTIADCPGAGPATSDLCDATSGGNLSKLDNLLPDPR